MNAVVTGATKGIGRAIAEKLAYEGFHVAICARTAADLKTFAESLSEEYPEQKFLYQAADMSLKSEVEGFAQYVLQAWGEVDLLVNNAGIFVPGEIHKEEEGVLEQLINTNLYSAYHLTRALLPPMMAQKSGHIFNICSIASIFAYPNGGSYSISKFALLGFSKVLREEMKAYHINVSSILPGATYTSAWSASGLPEERFSKSEHVASALYNAYTMGSHTCVEEIVLRPNLGDI